MRCPTHLSIGQEAVAAGVCANLGKKDEIISTHRSHAHYLGKGGNLKNMIAELYGKDKGCAKGLGGSMHLQDLDNGIFGSVPIVGSTTEERRISGYMSKNAPCHSASVPAG